MDRMRSDWDRRAREDANYYAAFGRREQEEAEFQATAVDVVRDLDRELRRLGRYPDKASLRALEVGCGPGRIMLPMSTRFGEIHGVDISTEMVRLARERLRETPTAPAFTPTPSSSTFPAARSSSTTCAKQGVSSNRAASRAARSTGCQPRPLGTTPGTACGSARTR